jgi:hypothetical protein
VVTKTKRRGLVEFLWKLLYRSTNRVPLLIKSCSTQDLWHYYYVMVLYDGCERTVLLSMVVFLSLW